MAGVAEPGTGLVFYELSHEWGHGAPALPGFDDVKLHRSTQHAKNGVMAHRIRMVMHSGTHLNAPLHLIQGGAAVGAIALDRFFGRGVVLSIPKIRWDLVEVADLEAARPAIEEDDIVVIVTGWHRKYSDSIEYFGHAPGLSQAAADWLVARQVKLVAVDTAQIDHPLATSLGRHRNGPQMKRLPGEYEAVTGRSASADFPAWNPAHRALLAAGIPTIENAGGDLDALVGRRCTFQAYPWYWLEGDACPIRFVAFLDPAGSYRLEPGAAASSPPKPRTTSPGGGDAAAPRLQFYNLSARWGHGMPEWPSAPGINVLTLQYHANNGVYVTEFDGIMHRGTHMDAPLHVTENTPTLTGYPIWRFFGTGVAVSIPKGKWGVITAEDLERATPTIRKNDIVMINTGTHRKLADSDAYYAYSPGLYKEAAEWLVEKQVKMVGVDVQALDHPLGTKLVDHGPGPSHPHLMDEYRRETGRDVMKDFPHWEVAHKTLMVKGGIPGIENINGDLDAITGKRCTFLAFPWRWPEGEGCGVRVVAILDPDQTFRFASG